MAEKKIAIRDIQIHWTENNGTENRTYPNLARVNSDLRHWSRTAPEDGCYHKTKFTVTWEDGNTYEGRIDLQRGAYGNIMGEHIRSYLRFLGGLAQPTHMTDEQYRHYTDNKKMVADALSFLETYDLEEGI